MFVLLTFSHLLVSRKCVLFTHLPCLSCSLFLTFLSLGSVCFPPPPPPPIECVLFPHRPCLSCSLFLAFSSLANCKTFHSLH
ncbi:hypothetical protein K438DRAFT_1822343 [Mycena galopus ATCC 62051]|nr:hypothetical protein K438DRAFT_1822343 [Mycena galopus ATCC 62051]